MLTKKQIEERKSYLGASESAAVLGKSRWSTPLEVWAIKTGQIEPEDIKNELAVEVGNELEDLVAKLFMKRTGKTVHRKKATIYHKAYPFIACNLDRRVVGEDAILECKTASGWKAKEWRDEEIPMEYIIQVMYQLAVTGKQTGYIACLIGGNHDFVYKTIARDENIIKDILKKTVYFWREFVQKKEMPGIITKNDGGILDQLFPMDEDAGEPIELEEEANILIDSIQAQEVDSKMLKGQIDTDKNRLKALLKENPSGVTDRFKITWKNQETRRLNSKLLREEKLDVWKEYAETSKSRVLRIAKIKGGKDGNTK